MVLLLMRFGADAQKKARNAGGHLWFKCFVISSPYPWILPQKTQSSGQRGSMRISMVVRRNKLVFLHDNETWELQRCLWLFVNGNSIESLDRWCITYPSTLGPYVIDVIGFSTPRFGNHSIIFDAVCKQLYANAVCVVSMRLERHKLHSWGLLLHYESHWSAQIDRFVRFPQLFLAPCCFFFQCSRTATASRCWT